MTFTTEFGFLNVPISLDAAGVLIRPCDDFEATAAAIRSEINPDGYFYPPTSETFRFPRWPDMTYKEPVPQTKRHAHLFDMPASHVLTLSTSGPEEALLDEATFTVQTLAYLYGTRLQPDGWQMDARVPVAQSTHPVHVGTAALRRFVPRALEEWRAQPTERRLRLTNVLYLHAKAPSYEWIWEQFLMEYVVLDAIYDYSFRTRTATSVAHAERIRELCGRYGLWCPVDAPVETLVTMRRTLFHEGLWEGERPGYKISAEAYNHAHDLRHLTQRLIGAILGGVSEYTRSRWADLSQYMFFS